MKILYFIALVALLAASVAAQEVYPGRQDAPSMNCGFGSTRGMCEGVNVYPATPKWTISSGGEILEDREAAVIYFDIPYKQWVEIYMDVVRSDGALVQLDMAVIHDNQNFYYLPLNNQTEFEGRIPPQWAYELPDYDRYYKDRAERLRTPDGD